MRTLLTAGILTLLLAAAAGGAPAQRSYRCTITGTPGPDVLIDTKGNDVICGLGGNDTIGAGLGDDVLIGGPGNDVLQGGARHDVMLGGPGRDTIHAWDGVRDRVDGGAGRDRAWVDRFDRVRSIERFG